MGFRKVDEYHAQHKFHTAPKYKLPFLSFFINNAMNIGENIRITLKLIYNCPIRIS